MAGPGGWPGAAEFPEPRMVDVDGCVLAVHDSAVRGRAPAGPPLVLLHGLTSSSALCWLPVFDALSADGRVLAVDLPGHGSSPRGESFTLEATAAVVARLIDQEFGCPALVVGFSMGGVVAQLLARRHPGSVAGLVLCSTAADFRPGSPRRRAIEPVNRVLLAAALGLPRPLQDRVGSALQALRVAMLRRNGDGSPRFLWSCEQVHAADGMGVAVAGNALRRHDGRAWISALQVPAAAVITAGDTIIDAERQRATARALAADPVIELDGDHGMFFNAAPIWSAAVLEACRAVTARLVPRPA